MKQPSSEIKREAIIAFVCVLFLLALTFACQILVFEKDWKLIGLSILIGTCCTLIGAFAALLASPYGAEDEARLNKVSTIIATLVTGFVLGKIIDPLITEAFTHSKEFFEIKNAANFLMSIIGFLGGFLGTYEYRAYISGKTSAIKQPSAIKNTEADLDIAAVSKSS